MCVLAFECECIVYEVLFLPLGIFYGKVFEDVWRGTRYCLDIIPQENDYGVVSCVVLDDFVFQGFKKYVSCVSNVAYVCCGIDGGDWSSELIHCRGWDIVVCVVVVMIGGGGGGFMVWVVYVALVWCCYWCVV